MQKLLTFCFSKNISIYAIFNDQSFNNTLTNDIVSFEQLGPDLFSEFQEQSALKCSLYITENHWNFRRDQGNNRERKTQIK